MSFRFTFFAAIFCCLFACQSSPRNKKPNFLMVIADDLGYSDLGCYGGEIKTRTIDSLANQGVLFTNFHTSAMCAPSRAMLLSSNTHHMAGWGRQRSVKGTIYEGKWGYENEWSDRVMSFTEVLDSAGYFNCFAGKWHLGESAYANPVNLGFDHSFALMQGAANHWNDIGLGLSKYDGEKSRYTENGLATNWPKGAYSTTLYADKIVDYLEQDRNKDDPFFALLSFTAPHWPLQPPATHQDLYLSQYNDGYDQWRRNRFNSLKKLGWIDETANLPEGLGHIPAWDSLSEESQKKEARKMELYAASLHHLDDQLSKVLNALRQMGELDNTIVIFLSDNGADFLDFYNNEAYGQFLRDKYSNAFENMGDPSSFVAYGPQWAQVSMAPFSYYKGYLAEGGIRAPLIISGKGIERNGYNESYIDIRDLAPTILELANINIAKAFQHSNKAPMTGKSMLPILKGEEYSIHHEDEFIIDEFQGKAYVRQGRWKFLNQTNPSDEKAFALYDLKTDPGEKIDKQSDHPEIISSFLKEWVDFQKENRIIFEEDVSKLNPYKEDIKKKTN